jgi:hypothetical protein
MDDAGPAPSRGPLAGTAAEVRCGATGMRVMRWARWPRTNASPRGRVLNAAGHTSWDWYEVVPLAAVRSDMLTMRDVTHNARDAAQQGHRVLLDSIYTDLL